MNVLEKNTLCKRKISSDIVRFLRNNVRMDRETPIALQLKKIREEAGIGVREMARRTGMSVGGYRHYETPKLFKSAYLPVEVSQKIAAAIGDRESATKVIELSGALEGLDSIEEGQEHEGLLRIENDEAPPADRKLIPVNSVEASAGHGSIIHDEYQEYSLAFPPNYLRILTQTNPKELSIISVKGESMEPTLLSNDIVLLDRSKKDLNYDGLFVLRFNDVLHVKRVGRSPKKGYVMIISDNKHLYPPIDAAITDIEPVGKVLWYGRKV